ncbi:MAG: hypothetical protein JNK89_11025, partial [Saprospiraceae bacterium]|nr:hypothetical protein [Saprospiraceae bacterium]
MKTLLLPAAGLMALGLFFTTACQNESGAQAKKTPAEDPKPEYFLYVAVVDNLNLRDKPGQSFKVLGQLKEGELAEGDGEVSELVEQVELRGILHKSPYLGVQRTGGQGLGGWAFGGGLLCLYSGPKAQAPDLAKTSVFSNFLSQLDPRQLESGGKAWKYVDTELADAQGPLADAAFILLEHFFRRMEAEGELYKLTEKVPFSKADIKAILDKNFDTNRFPATAALTANGLTLTTGEGTIFPVVDYLRFQDHFGPICTPAMQKFINQRASEHKTQIFDDGGIIIPIYLVADVAAFWEKFNRQNPYFPLAAECQESERFMLLTTLTGSNNTPVYDYETKAIEEDFILAWRYVLREYPDTKLGRTVAELSALCEAEG